MYEFNYQKASSIDEAKSFHDASEEPKYMSGGMILLPTLKQRLARPSNVIDLAAGQLERISYVSATTLSEENRW